jgi:outer membrane lipoprotein-sorting protein
MYKFLFVVCGVVSLTSLASGQQLSPSEVKELLSKIRAHRAAAPQVQGDFREEKRMRLMNRPVVAAGKIWFQAPDKFRREVKGNAPSVTVSNGRDLWIYYPNFKSAERYTLGKRSPVDAAIAAINTALNMENIENTFHVTGSKIASGYELELQPRSAAMKRAFQKFDIRMNADLVADQTDILQPNGDRVVTNYSNQSRAPIPASTFDFTPPPGTEVTTPLGR